MPDKLQISELDADNAILRVLKAHQVKGAYSITDDIVDALRNASQGTENVAVALRNFESPSEAAAYTGKTWTYAADKALKLTIGDRVLVPVGGRGYDLDHREGTVVGLNATCPVDYIKRVTRLLP